jgi:hypothetical protein
VLFFPVVVVFVFLTLCLRIGFGGGRAAEVEGVETESGIPALGGFRPGCCCG